MSKRSDKLAADAAVNETAIPAAETAAETAATEREKTSVTQVYCGPTVRGVAKQYTVYRWRLSRRHWRAFSASSPGRAGALDGGRWERFAETRKRLETGEELIKGGRVHSVRQDQIQN